VYCFGHFKSEVSNRVNLSAQRKLRANTLTQPPFLLAIFYPNRLFRSLLSVIHFCVAVLCANPVIIRSGSTLLEIKKSFRNVGNVLYDWAGDDYCSWRGVLCDNVTFAVAAL
jgi:hypothetical protein